MKTKLNPALLSQSMRLYRLSACWFYALMSLTSLIVGCGQPTKQPPTESRLNPTFKRVPPKVENTTLRRLSDPTSDGNTVFIVTFAPDPRLSDRVFITLDQREVMLRDDGQGVDERAGDRKFSGVINLAIEDLAATNKHIDSLRQRFPTVPVFEGRRLIGRRDLISIDLERFRQGLPIDFFPLGIPAVDPTRSLVIRATSVVEDPTRTFNPCTGAGTAMGRWTFGHLMKEMANEPVTGIQPAVFVRRWLNRWRVPQVINDDLVPARLDIDNVIIKPWEVASGVGPGGTLDLAKAPFKLLAIVNRVDLRENAIYGGGNAGEARFVFGAVDLKSNCKALRFTVIFEYGIKKSGCFAIKAWGKQWLDLQLHPLGSPAYNAALQAITDQFVSAGADPAKLPNKSALNQLRTNEIVLANPWELREFRIFADDSDAGHLREVTVKQTPDFDLNGQAVIADYINANEAAILAGTYQVPLEFPPGSPFLGGAAPTPFGMFWNSPGISSPEARHVFSLNTCNGCHAGETNTPFTHIFPAAFGNAAGLSGFLTGISVADPVAGTPSRNFNDLDRRAQDLDALVHSLCFAIIAQRPLLMTH